MSPAHPEIPCFNLAAVAGTWINNVGVLFMGSGMPHRNSGHLRQREVLKGPLCQARKGKHTGQMRLSAKIQIAPPLPLKGCLIWGLMRMNMRIISAEGSRRNELWWGCGHTHAKAHTLSLASLGCVFYQNQCQCVQENTIHVTGSGFSGIYYRQGGAAALLWSMVLYCWLDALCPPVQMHISALFEFRRLTNILIWQTACRCLNVCLCTYIHTYIHVYIIIFVPAVFFTCLLI